MAEITASHILYYLCGRFSEYRLNLAQFSQDNFVFMLHIVFFSSSFDDLWCDTSLYCILSYWIIVHSLIISWAILSFSPSLSSHHSPKVTGLTPTLWPFDFLLLAACNVIDLTFYGNAGNWGLFGCCTHSKWLWKNKNTSQTTEPFKRLLLDRVVRSRIG